LEVKAPYKLLLNWVGERDHRRPPAEFIRGEKEHYCILTGIC
jgi:hypothetical protein